MRASVSTTTSRARCARDRSRLDQPVQRVTGAEAAPSISKVLERAACARTEEVVDGLRRVMRDKGYGAPIFDRKRA